MKNYYKEFEKNESKRTKLDCQDITLMSELLKEIGGKYEFHLSEDYYVPRVVCNAWDEPCDVEVHSIYLDENEHIRLDVEYGLEEYDICIEEIEGSHIAYICYCMKIDYED